ncbi:MAG TPA: alpha/beta hydrolase [Actinoplanes sp.]|nr:alpha/beta hydrolase [Actinoplanes sp.]
MTDRAELVQQIVQLLDIRLLDPLELLLEGDDVVDAMRDVVRVRAGRWADEMLTGDDASAVGIAARLISSLYPGDRAFDPPPEWWQTPIGRVVARRVGHPGAESVSYAVAGAMLGISRQGVHDLVRRGRLPRHPEGGVPARAIRDRLRLITEEPRGEAVINDRLIDAGELPIAVRDFGGLNPPLVLLHGAGGNLANMTTLARALRPRFRVITMDLRGHGRSGDGPWSWDAALADLAAVVVQTELRNPAVVGHSLGGMIAALWGQRHPESAGVVSLDGNPAPTRPDQLSGLDTAKAEAELARLHHVFDTMQAGIGRVIEADQLADLVERQQMAARDMGANEKVWIEGFRRNLVHRNGQTSMRPSSGTAAELRTLMNDLDLGLVYAGVTCPALVVLATRNLPEQEPFADLYAAYRRYLVAQVQQAGVPFLQLEDASHAMVIEQPGALATLIGDFLRR